MTPRRRTRSRRTRVTPQECEFYGITQLQLPDGDWACEHLYEEMATEQRASRVINPVTGKVNPDRAKDQPLTTAGPSAPTTHATGSGVDIKYSR